MKKTATLVLCKRSDRYSPINTGIYILFTFFDVDTGELLECAVDSSYRNFSHWNNIINDPLPIGIYSNLIVTKRKTKDGLKIVSADSYPQLQEKMTMDQLIQLIEIATTELK